MKVQEMIERLLKLPRDCDVVFSIQTPTNEAHTHMTDITSVEFGWFTDHAGFEDRSCVVLRSRTARGILHHKEIKS
jgi:hypothetical protein